MPYFINLAKETAPNPIYFDVENVTGFRTHQNTMLVFRSNEAPIQFNMAGMDVEGIAKKISAVGINLLPLPERMLSARGNSYYIRPEAVSLLAIDKGEDVSDLHYVTLQAVGHQFREGFAASKADIAALVSAMEKSGKEFLTFKADQLAYAAHVDPALLYLSPKVIKAIEHENRSPENITFHHDPMGRVRLKANADDAAVIVGTLAQKAGLTYIAGKNANVYLKPSEIERITHVGDDGVIFGLRSSFQSAVMGIRTGYSYNLEEVGVTLANADQRKTAIDALLQKRGGLRA